LVLRADESSNRRIFKILAKDATEARLIVSKFKAGASEL
jgi:hypothetical protein